MTYETPTIPATYRIANVADMPDPRADVFADEADNLRCSECGRLIYITPFTDGESLKSAVCLNVKCSAYQVLRDLKQEEMR